MNRTVMARRARSSTVNTAARIPLGSITPITPIGHVKKTRAMKMTGAQRNSEGRRSEWSMSPEFFTDPKWSATCSG